jgi:hypothetical protein
MKPQRKLLSTGTSERFIAGFEVLLRAWWPNAEVERKGSELWITASAWTNRRAADALHAYRFGWSEHRRCATSEQGARDRAPS